MKKRIANGFIWCMVLIFVGAGGLLYAGEHPSEHPTGKKEVALSKEDLAEAITAYVKKEAAKTGGYYQVYDKEAKKTLSLTLDRVHKERLATIGNNTYFVCADFKTPEGKLYDLDFFMKGTAKDNLEVTEITVHKEDGKPRYTWYEEGGIWKKKTVAPAAPATEHEHPKGAEHPS